MHARTDIVQFVPFRRFQGAPLWRLAQETLAELPRQLVGYMKMTHAKPLPRRAMLMPQYSTFVGQVWLPLALSHPLARC